MLPSSQMPYAVVAIDLGTLINEYVDVDESYMNALASVGYVPGIVGALTTVSVLPTA